MAVRHSVDRRGGPSHTGVILGFGCRLAMFSRGTHPVYCGTGSGFLCPLREVTLFGFHHTGFLLVVCPSREYYEAVRGYRVVRHLLWASVAFPSLCPPDMEWYMSCMQGSAS